MLSPLAHIHPDLWREASQLSKALAAAHALQTAT
jgi:hypothetical protein